MVNVYVWTLQELHGDARLSEVVDDNLQAFFVGLGVEVSQQGNVETIILFPPWKGTIRSVLNTVKT